MKNNKLIFLFGLAILVKLALFSYAAIHAPQSKFLIDSSDYLKPAEIVATHGVFARNVQDGHFEYEIYRVPGYPAFLALFHFRLGWPLDVIILIQIFLTLWASVLVYKSALLIDERLAFLSVMIMLFDPTITVYSLMILSESLFLILLSAFLYSFIRYLKAFQLRWLILSGIMLAGATYVRPINFFLGMAVAVFIVTRSLRSSWKRGLAHGILLLLIVYTLTGIWQYRNYQHGGTGQFCSMTDVVVKSTGLINSYERSPKNISSHGNPFIYYSDATARSILALLTRPPSLKYFDSDILKAAAKVVSYPFMIFLSAGFLIGLTKSARSDYLLLMAVGALYFIGMTVAGMVWPDGPRYRIALMPFMAILSAYGWTLVIKSS